MMSDSVYPVVLSAFAAFVASAVLNLLLLTPRLRMLLLDHPNERSLHAAPVPRVGGVAIIAGALLGLAMGDLSIILAERVTAGVLLLLLLSLTDDARGLPILPRLLFHIVVCIGAAWPYIENLSWMVIFLVAAAMTWMINLYNFMDGADGLAGGMSFIGFGFFALAMYSTNVSADYPLLWCVVLASASLAFLCFNFSPARIFMGDCGSVPLGFAAAWFAVYGSYNNVWPTVYSVLVFAPFIFDASVTLLKRVLRGERFWQAHREHYYQRLIRMGWSHRKTALVYYALMVICGTVAYFSLLPAERSFVPFGLLFVLGVLLMAAVDRQWKIFEAEMASFEQ